MQKKTINKIVTIKIDNWLDSLPTELAKEVKPNILVSGGCIASLFLKEPVNDYDIYIKDIDVLRKLAQYYLDPEHIPIFDGRQKEFYLGELEKENGNKSRYGMDLSEQAVFFHALKPDQIKLGVSGAGTRFELEEKEIEKKDLYKLAFISRNAISLSNDIQIVTRFSGTNEEIHKNFDFIHATNYWTYDTKLVTNLKAVESLLTKQLRYQGSLYPLTSVIRMKKFILRGWKISAGEILKILYQTSKLNLDDPIVLEDQLVGVDIAYFSDLIRLINSVDPVLRTPEFFIRAIDKIFNDE